MHRSLLLLGLLLIAPAGFAQAPSSDSQTLQALLSELRQLRKELEAHSTALQRTQLLFFRLQAQQALVERASQRVEDARNRLAEIQNDRKRAEVVAKTAQERLDHPDPADDRKALENELAFYKQHLEELPGEEQQRQARLSEAEEQLRAEQAKLDELNAQLDALDKASQKAASKPD